MKRLAPIFAAVLLLGGIASSQVAIRQTFKGYWTSGTTFTVAYSGVTVGDLLVVGCSSYRASGGAPTCSFSDGGGAYYSGASCASGSGVIAYGSAEAPYVAIACKIADQTSGTLTITVPTITHAGAVIYDIYNQASSNPMESTCTNYVSSTISGTQYSCGSAMTLTGSSELVIAIANVNSIADGWTAGTSGSGYTCDYVLGSATTTCVTSYQGLAEHQAWTSSPPSTNNPNAAYGQSSDKLIIVGVAIKGGSAAASTPTFSPVAGSYGPTQNVTISSSSSGAIICYNTTGSPATNGASGCTTGSLYSSPVAVSASETLYAVAGGTGWLDSSVGSAAYTINGALPTPSISPAGGNYASQQSVTITDSNGSAAIIYTTDASTPGTSSGCTPSGTGATYSGAFNTVSSGAETVKAIACLATWSNSSAASNSYTIAAGTTAPTISPNGGYFFSSLPSVTLADSQGGTTIYYTTDGSTPTTGSSVYSTPLTTTSGETIKAAAIASGYVLSTVASATFTLSSLTPLVTDTFYGWTDFTTSPTPQLQQQGYTTCDYTYCGFPTDWPAGTAGMTWMTAAHTNGQWTPLGASGVTYPVLSPDGNGYNGVQNVAGCSQCLLNGSGNYNTTSPAAEIVEYTGGTFPANQWFDTTVYGQAGSGGGLGPCIHLTSATAGYCAALNYGTIELLKLPNTNLASGSNSQMTGTVKLDVTLEQTSANNYAVLINGSSVLTASDTAYPTGNPGIYVGQYQSTSYPPEIIAAYGGIVGTGVLSAPQPQEVSIPGLIYSDALSTAVPQPPWTMTPTGLPGEISFTGQTCGNAFQSAEYRVPTGNDQFGQFTVNTTITDGYLGGEFIMLHHQSQEQGGVPGAHLGGSCTGNVCYDAISYYCGFEPLQNDCAASTKEEYCSQHFHCTKVTPQVSSTGNQVDSVTTSTYTAAVTDNVRVEYHGTRLYGLKQVGGTGQWAIVFQKFDSDLFNSPGYVGLFCGSSGAGESTNYVTNWQSGTLQDYADIQQPCTVTNSCGTGQSGNSIIW